MEEMKHLCPICSSELKEIEIHGEVKYVCEKCNAHFKKMCLNCRHISGVKCCSPKNMEAAIEKIKANMPSGYEIKNIELNPLDLKDPTKKCKNYEAAEGIVEDWARNVMNNLE